MKLLTYFLTCSSVIFALNASKSVVIYIDGENVKYSGDSLNIIIEYVNIDSFCRIDPLELDSSFSGVGSLSALVTSTIGSTIFTLDITLRENVQDFVRKSVKVICSFDGGNLEKNLTLLIGKLNPKYNIGPFFMQTIYDNSKRSYCDICYYLKAGHKQYLNLYQDYQNRFFINALITEQDKIQNILINSTIMNIQLTTNSIIIDKFYNIDWNDCSEIFQLNTPKISLICYDNTLNIKLSKPNSNNLYPSLTFKKLQLTKSSYHLGIYSLNLSDYSSVDGLFGRIGRNKYEFFNLTLRKSINVRNKNNEVTDSSTTIQINNRLTAAKQIKQDSKTCWLVDVQDVIKPLKIENFLSEYQQ